MRKVLGASEARLVGLLARGFLAPVVGAALVAAPLAYLAAERWLGTFAHRVEVGAGTLLVAAGATLLVAFATVSVHTLRAALADPVTSLRYE